MLAARLPGDVGAFLLEATLAPSEFLSCQARSASASCGESAMRAGGGDGEGGLGEVGGGDQGMDASSNNVEGESSRGVKHTDGLANTRQCTDKG